MRSVRSRIVVAGVTLLVFGAIEEAGPTRGLLLVGGGIFLMLFVAWQRGRRELPARRIAAGLCPQCGYSLTGNVSGVCPECGTPAPTKGAA